MYCSAKRASRAGEMACSRALTEGSQLKTSGKTACAACSVPRTGSFTALYSGGDGRGVSDQHPDFPQVCIASPCSGHSFKFCSVVGEIMADLTERGDTRHDIAMYRLPRLLT